MKVRVRPVRPTDPDTAARLIRLLDSETFTEREEAQRALAKMGEGVAHLLVKSLEGKIGLEMCRRLTDLLSKCEETSTLDMQHHRAVATLEWIAHPPPALLRTLADGAPRARLTIEALAAWKRLQG